MISFTNARVVDGKSPEAGKPTTVTVADGLIAGIGGKPFANAEVIDLKGKTLMPGLIDAHVHVVAGLASLGANGALPDGLVALRAAKIMRAMLMRGFTSVRDVGGATHALVQAHAEGLFEGPRLSVCGKALGQTGGHTDFRGRYDPRPGFDQRLGALGRICDGVDAVRQAAREEIKGGAAFIKIMANGGVASPTDPIHFLGFARDEIAAAVEEARNAGTYVAAHLYTDEAIARCVELGVHSLEHCNLITAKTAKAAAKAGCVAVPTLVTYDALAKEGAAMGFPADSVAKIDTVRLKGLESLTIMKKAGLTMAYGTDLLGEMHRHQSEEFVLRGAVLPADEVIASATHLAAPLLTFDKPAGVIAEGALADLIVVDGDPLKDLTLLTKQGRHMPVIMQGGRFMKRERLN